jgi:putative heme-binding domain-containing protein
MMAPEKTAALNTLVARRESALALMAAFDARQIPLKDLGASLARLMQSLQQEDIDQWLNKNFGALNQSNAARLEEIERYGRFLGTEAILSADVKNGQALYQRTCAACHEIFGEGGHIGPELPGNYTDLDYLLRNVLDPNAEIGRDFQQTYITTKSGNLIVGVLINEDAKSLTLKTLASPITIALDDIAKRELSPLSMMPEGLLNSLQEQEVRDLFLYLRQSFYPKASNP